MYESEARAGGVFLDRLRAEKDLDWTFLSPSALFQAGQHQLGPHGAVAKQGALPNCIEQRFFHGTLFEPAESAASMLNGRLKTTSNFHRAAVSN